MKFSLSVAALFAIYGQALSEKGVGEFRIFQQRPGGTPKSLSIQGGLPTFGPPGSGYENWRITQVGATSDGDKIVNVQSVSAGSYLSCSTTDERAPCELKNSKFSVQPFVERYVDSRGTTDGIYIFYDEKTGKFLSTNEAVGSLSLTASHSDGVYYVLVRSETGDN